MKSMKKSGVLVSLKVFTFFFSLAYAFSASAAASSAQGGRFGLGAIFGSPTAITGKLRQFHKKNSSLDFGLAFSFNDSVLMYSDYLLEYPGSIDSSEEFFKECTPYIGFGGVIAIVQKDNAKNEAYRGKTSGSVGVAARLPLGIEWNPKTIPLGVFLELAPAISVIPETSGIFFGGIGVRYFF